LKTQIEVFVPVLGKNYDIMTPKNIRVGDCLELVIRSIQDMSEGLFVGSPEVKLYYRIGGEVVDINQSIEHAGIINGTQLMLI
jgi:hypothetical protein